MNRRNLIKAHQEMKEGGYSMEVNPQFDKIEPLLSATFKAKEFSLGRYRSRMSSWWQTVFNNDSGQAYLVTNSEGSPVCATLMVWDSRKAYYLAGGMLNEIRETKHLNLLLFERMISDAHRLGLDFDFEGSVLPGVESFFRGWGGKLLRVNRVIKIPSAVAYLQWAVYRYLTRHRHRERGDFF